MRALNTRMRHENIPLEVTNLRTLIIIPSGLLKRRVSMAIDARNTFIHCRVQRKYTFTLHMRIPLLTLYSALLGWMGYSFSARDMLFWVLNVNSTLW